MLFGSLRKDPAGHARLEADGAHLKLYVDGEEVIDVWHRPFEGAGHVGFDQEDAEAQFDNVTVSTRDEPLPASGRHLFEAFNGGDEDGTGEERPVHVWHFDGPEWEILGTMLLKRSTNPGGRAAGLVRQIQQRQFSASFDMKLHPTSTDDSRYVALHFRKSSPSSPYYNDGARLDITDGGTLRLYNQVDGVLAETQLPFDPSERWHKYGVESDGARLRALVDREVVLDVPDPHRSSGRYLGFAEDRSGARFDNLRIFGGAEGAEEAAGERLSYEYHLKDHLGNTRVAFAVGAGGSAEVVQRAGYYPYGLQLAGLGNSSSDNDYLYNGKELEDSHGLRWYHYGARFYDPALARWASMDPADQFHSPYSYVGGNPVNLIDPDGMQAVNPDNPVQMDPVTVTAERQTGWTVERQPFFGFMLHDQLFGSGFSEAPFDVDYHRVGGDLYRSYRADRRVCSRTR